MIIYLFIIIMYIYKLQLKRISFLFLFLLQNFHHHIYNFSKHNTFSTIFKNKVEKKIKNKNKQIF